MRTQLCKPEVILWSQVDGMGFPGFDATRRRGCCEQACALGHGSANVKRFKFAAMIETLEALSHVATILGIPFAILAYVQQKKKDRRQREMETHLEANERYVEYLKLCLDHPEWGGFDIDGTDPEIIELGIDVRKLTLFEVLISVLESAYLLYQTHESEIREAQWKGWVGYMNLWARRDDFRRAWPSLRHNFDRSFVEDMDRTMSTVTSGEARG